MTDHADGVNLQVARKEPTPSRFPPPASTGILQGLHRHRLSRRTVVLLLVLALLILGSAGGLYAIMHISPAKTQPTATANGVVYFGSNDGYLYALDAASGAKKWAYLTGDSIISSPAVVYVGSNEGKVYAFHVPSI